MLGNWRLGNEMVKEHTLFLMEEKGVGEFRENKSWNITTYDKNGNILGKWANGVLQK